MKHLMMICALIIAAPQASAQTFDNATTELHSVASRFQHAIKYKDKAEFLSLFLQPSATTWQEVLSNRALTEEKGGVPKAAFDATNNPIAFIDSILSRKGISDEEFGTLKIAHDADSASISFDYIFKIDGVAINAGMEHWLLVRSGRGWRIVSVVWSVK